VGVREGQLQRPVGAVVPERHDWSLGRRGDDYKGWKDTSKDQLRERVRREEGRQRKVEGQPWLHGQQGPRRLGGRNTG
jgi:hypothetical protein